MPKKTKAQRRQTAKQQRQEKNADRARKRELARQRKRANKGQWESDMKKFRDQLARYGLRVKETRPDGNCMFRAVADQMYGDQERHEEIRDATVAYLRSHEDDFAFWIVDESFEDYCNRMGRNKQWGSHLELQAISNCFNINLCIHQLATPRWEIVNAPPTAQNLHLSYHDGEHYNSVRNKSDPGGGPAEKIVIGTPTSGPGGSSAVNMGDVANADERLVMQSTGKSLEEVRETLEMLGGDAGYAIEYLIAMANDEAEQAAASAPPSTVASSEPRGAAAVAVAAPAPSGGVDGDGSAGGDVGVPPSLVAAAAGMSEEAAMAAALRASLEDAQAKKPARHGGDGSGGGNGGTVTSGKKEKKKKSKMPLKKGAPCPCGSGRKYGKCCRKRMKHLERLEKQAAKGPLSNKERKKMAKLQKKGGGSDGKVDDSSEEEFVDDLGSLQI